MLLLVVVRTLGEEVLPLVEIRDVEEALTFEAQVAREMADVGADLLNEALEETFPASDPIAVDPEEDPTEPPTREKKRH